jgi:hypothetical protein
MYRENLSPVSDKPSKFSRQEIPYSPAIPLKIKGGVWRAACHIQSGSQVMIIFALTFAILSLFALSLTGSIATATRRRS